MAVRRVSTNPATGRPSVQRKPSSKLLWIALVCAAAMAARLVVFTSRTTFLDLDGELLRKHVDAEEARVQQEAVGEATVPPQKTAGDEGFRPMVLKKPAAPKLSAFKDDEDDKDDENESTSAPTTVTTTTGTVDSKQKSEKEEVEEVEEAEEEKEDSKEKGEKEEVEEVEAVEEAKEEKDLFFQDPNAPVVDWDYFPDRVEPRRDPSWREHPRVVESLPLLTKDQCEIILKTVDASPPPRREPTHRACNGYEGVFHIHQFDRGGASGTAFFIFALGMAAWADQHNYLPWIHLENGVTKPIWDPIVHLNITQPPLEIHYRKLSEKILWFRDPTDPDWNLFPGKPGPTDDFKAKHKVLKGTGVWEHYFLPPNDFVPGDTSCANKPMVRMHETQIIPGIHSNAPWAPRAGKYSESTIVLPREGQSMKDWFRIQRTRGARLAERHLRFNPAMERRAHCAFPDPTFSLGLHIRHTDKHLERYVIETDVFLGYARAFVDHGGKTIFVATDSSKVFETIFNDWPKDISSRVVHQTSVVGLSSNTTAAFNLGISRHRTNVEALTDILALSKSTFLIHGLSAMTEAVFYLNPDLMDRAVNLDDEEENFTPEKFVNDILPLGKQA